MLELAKLYQAFGDDPSIHFIVVTACSVLQVLLLQMPRVKSKSKEYKVCLERHLALWQQGDIASLLQEGKCIQDHFPVSNSAESKSRIAARHFDHLMLMGKV